MVDERVKLGTVLATDVLTFFFVLNAHSFIQNMAPCDSVLPVSEGNISRLSLPILQICPLYCF
jgi:hypothetical protein